MECSLGLLLTAPLYRCGHRVKSLRQQSVSARTPPPPPDRPTVPDVDRNVSFTCVHMFLSVRGLHLAHSRYSLFMPNCGVPGSGMQGRGHTQPPTTALQPSVAPLAGCRQLQDRVRRFVSLKFQQGYRFCITELGRSPAATRSVPGTVSCHDCNSGRASITFYRASGLGVLAFQYSSIQYLIRHITSVESLILHRCLVIYIPKQVFF